MKVHDSATNPILQLASSKNSKGSEA